MNPCHISVDSLWKVFGKKPERALDPEHIGKDRGAIAAELGCVVALRDVSFQVNPGEIFVVMGLSGSGKSTLVRCLIRLIEPTAGAITIDGQDILGYDKQQLIDLRRDQVAMVFQHYGLLPHRSVLENAAWGLEVRGVGKAARYSRTREMLDLVGLHGWEQAYPRELSGGMQQRVGLARALAVDPKVLLMDEPFSGLDPLIRRNMQEELLRLHRDLHKTIVFITHDLGEALKLGDRIAIMRDGQIVQTGSPEDIVLAPKDEYVSEFTRDVRRESIMTASGLMVPPRAVIFDHQGPAAALRALQSAGTPAVMVVDAADKYLGMLITEQAQNAVRAQVQRLSENPEYLDRQLSPVSPQTSVDDLMVCCITTQLPIPVVDDKGKLVGEVSQGAVAAAASRRGTAPGREDP